jgi:DNA-binding transcriptional ArsR family regulator
MNWEHIARAGQHQLRLRILEHLLDTGGTASPNELSKAFGEPLGNVSYHVGKLAEQELIELAWTEPRRGAVEHFYRATEKARGAVPDVAVGDDEEAALGRLEDALFEAMAAGVNAEQLAHRFRQLEVREAGEAVAA